MSVIIYGGTKSQIKKQLSCKHRWYDPCIDDMGRYTKCVKCFCLNRDLKSQKEYEEDINK